jgi:hypothetical protein
MTFEWVIHVERIRNGIWFAVVLVTTGMSVGQVVVAKAANKSLTALYKQVAQVQTEFEAECYLKPGLATDIEGPTSPKTASLPGEQEGNVNGAEKAGC